MSLRSVSDGLPEMLKNNLMTHFNIDGTVPITLQQVENLFTAFQNQIMAQINDLANARSTAAATHGESTVMDVDESDDSSPFDWFQWGGRFHCVPEGFVLGSMNVKALWHLWHHGDRGRRIAPYKHIKKGDLITDADKTNLNRARKVTSALFDLAVMVGGVPGSVVSVDNVSQLSHAVSQSIFQAGYHHFIQLLVLYFPSCSSRRWDEIQYTTLYQDVIRLWEAMDVEEI